VCVCVHLITVRFREIRRFLLLLLAVRLRCVFIRHLTCIAATEGINISIRVEYCGGGGTSESFEGRNPFQLGTRIHMHIMPFVINIHQLRVTLVVYYIYMHVYLFIVHDERRTNAFD